MPLFLSTAMIVEKNRLTSNHNWVWLFEVQITGTPGPLRLAMFDQPIVFHGQTFVPSGLEVDSLEDATHAALVNLRVTVQNVDQTMMVLYENYWVTTQSPDWRVLQWQVDTTMPNEMPYGNANVYSVQQTVTDLRRAVVELVLEGVTLAAVIPKQRYVATNGFPNLPRR